MAGSKRAPAAKADPEPVGADDAAPPGESPVVAVISKRLRNLRKKLKNVEGLEALQREGKELNPEQLCALAAKGSVKGAADELERLLATLPAALDEERAAATAQGRALAAADAVLAAATAPPPRAPTPPPPPPRGISPEEAEELAASRVSALMEALYLSRLFDVTEEGRPTFGAQMERSAAISWDAYTAAADQDPLVPADLEALAQFGRVLTSRAPTATLAHRDALRRCTSLAQVWAARGSAPVPGLAVGTERLRDRCARVLASEYFAQTPVMQTCTADAARQTAAAAAAAGAAAAALAGPPSAALFPAAAAAASDLFAGGPPLWAGPQFGDFDPRII